MLALGWVFFFLGWVMNIIFYGVHPCDVSLSPNSIREKLPHSLSIPIPKSPTSLSGSEMKHSDGKIKICLRLLLILSCTFQLLTADD